MTDTAPDPSSTSEPDPPVAEPTSSSTDSPPPAEPPKRRRSSTLSEPEPRAATTWYAPNQQSVRADGSGPAAIYAKGATAGIPGAWTPAGAIVPESQETVMAGEPYPITAAPATAWTTGQFVQTATAGPAGRVCWTGSAWVGGAAP